MNDSSTNVNTETSDVVVTRVLDAPVEEVWKAWSDPAYVTRWWGPDFIRPGDVADTFRIGEMLLGDEHDRIHKATGGWLREAGKKDRERLLGFLDKYAATMPRTMLRYAIEHLDKEQRAHYMGMTRVAETGQNLKGARS